MIQMVNALNKANFGGSRVVTCYTNTTVGLVPTQIDDSDYREVSGVKMPFHWVVTWTDGQSTIDLSDVQANVPIDAVRFTQPAPAVVRKVKPGGKR